MAYINLNFSYMLKNVKILLDMIAGILYNNSAMFNGLLRNGVEKIFYGK